MFMKILFNLINPIVKVLLRSPLHSLISNNTMIIEYVGHKSGRVMSTPVSYVRKGNDIFSFADPIHLWWKNLKANNDVQLTIEGKGYKGKAQIIENQDEVLVSYSFFLNILPRSAKFSNIQLDENNCPLMDDVVLASKKIKFVKIELS